MSALVTYSSSSEYSDSEDVEDENVMPRAKKPRSEGDLGLVEANNLINNY